MGNKPVGEAEASRLRGLRSGNAVLDDMDRGVYLRIVDILEGVVEVDERYVGANVESCDLTTADHRGLLDKGVGPGRGTGATGGVYTP